MYFKRLGIVVALFAQHAVSGAEFRLGGVLGNVNVFGDLAATLQLGSAMDGSFVIAAAHQLSSDIDANGESVWTVSWSKSYFIAASATEGIWLRPDGFVEQLPIESGTIRATGRDFAAYQDKALGVVVVHAASGWQLKYTGTVLASVTTPRQKSFSVESRGASVARIASLQDGRAIIANVFDDEGRLVAMDLQENGRVVCRYNGFLRTPYEINAPDHKYTMFYNSERLVRTVERDGVPVLSCTWRRRRTYEELPNDHVLVSDGEKTYSVRWRVYTIDLASESRAEGKEFLSIDRVPYIAEPSRMLELLEFE